jgi:hypothetical protein
MDDILLNSLPSEDELSLHNIDKYASQIKIDENEEKVHCLYLDAVSKKKILLAEIDLQTSISRIYPINTIEDSKYYLEPKYDIKEFVFEGYKTEISKTDYHEDAIYGLPKGFTKTLHYGLGLEKKYKIIITSLLKYYDECERIFVSKSRKTGIENKDLIINDTDFDKIRRGIDRNHDLFQREATLAKESFIYDNILNSTNPEKYPELKRKPRKEVIYKVLRNTDFKNLSKNDKQSLSKLKDNTDLSYLSILTNEFEQKLSNNHLEATYQLFFEENPLLLTMLSGSPYVQFKNQAYVGGKSFDNSNGQYPDFLQKHKMTNNTFIVEIKTPQSLLLEKRPYRKTGVYSASKDLSGSISQILTQKYQLETDIASLMKNADDRDVEAYNVQGLIIIGRLSSLEEKAMKRSFELYRNNQKNLRIITYDECLEQLKSFVELLSKSKTIVDDENTDNDI